MDSAPVHKALLILKLGFEANKARPDLQLLAIVVNEFSTKFSSFPPQIIGILAFDILKFGFSR
jgi:hypothetical protein